MQNVGTLRSRSVFVTTPFSILALVSILCLALDMSGLGSPQAYAFDISKGAMKGNLDTTVSTGISLRVEDRDNDLIGVPNGGNVWSINSDDGNLNYDQGDVVSLNAKVTHELQLKLKNFGFFGRMYYFYDWAIMKFDTERTAFTENARRRAGMDIKLLDAYVTGDFKLFDRPLTVRLGNQVVNWGESTFIQNGINVINPIDVTLLRVAGAELREALIAVPLITISTNITQNLSLEGFYQFYWDNTEIEPLGTFFSTTDIASPGASKAFLKFGRKPPQGPKDYPLTHTKPQEITSDPAEALLTYSDPLGDWVPRADDREPTNKGQAGAALRYLASWLYDTEFGLYYVHYHSRLPLVSGHTGPDPGWEGILQYLLESYGGEGEGFASTSVYYREFPENINLYGASFNTDIGSIGLAVQGEVSYRPNQPIQVDDVEVLLAAFSPLDPYLTVLKSLPEGEKIFGNSQLGIQDFNQDITGYRRKDMWQPQLTLTKVFGPNLGADQLVLIGEWGATIFPDLEDKSELRYDGPGTVCSGNSFFTDTPDQRKVQPATQEGGFADGFSWGYRLAARMDFNNALGPVGLQPTVAFSHDVGGTTPLPIGNFVEHRKAVTLGLTANYLNMLRGNLSYTNYFDGGEHNLLHDRDFVSLTASYSF